MKDKMRYLLLLALPIVPLIRLLQDKPMLPLQAPYEALSTIPSPLLLALCSGSLILAGILFHNILTLNKWSPETTRLAVMLYAVNPVILWAASGQLTFSLTCMLFALTWWLMQKNSKLYTIAAACLTSLGWWQALLAVGTGIAFKGWGAPIIGAIGLIIFRPEIQSVTLVEFGNPSGYSVFPVILAIMGITAVWKSKKKYYRIYLLSTLAIIGSIWAEALRAGVLMVFSALGARAIAHVKNTKWEIKILQSLTILVICCGLLFGWLTNAYQLAEAPPSAETAQTLKSLKEYGDGKVLVPEDYIVWAEHFSEKQALKNKTALKSAIESFSLDTTIRILNQHGIKYVVITEEMRQTWDRPDEGLQLVVKNNKTFKSPEPGIWVVKDA